MKTYGQFCPVAKAAELLDERWTLLVLRELFAGSTHFNELRRGVPRMSPSLLSKRLKALVRAGVLDRFEDGDTVVYRLTPAGEELKPLIEALGAWGVRWIGELGDADYDPHLLLWDMHRRVDVQALPPGRTVIHFRFASLPADTRDWWLVLAPEGVVDVCDFDPGFGDDLVMESDLPTLVHVWRGDIDWSEALRSGAVRLQGPASLRRALPRWFQLSVFAAVARPQVGQATLDPSPS